MNHYAVWFRRFVILGILINLFFALPGIFIPNAVISIVNLDPARDPIWLAFSANLLVLLSLFYIPAALNPFRNAFAAVLTVLARFAGAAFFLCIWSEGARVFGYLDLTLGIVQGLLLFATFRHGPGAD